MQVHAPRDSAAGPDPAALPVVLVHGYGVSAAYWRPLALRLSASRAVYAPDLPGHGRSAPAATPLDVGGLALSLLAVLDALGLGRVALVGQSLGAQVAAEAAARAPSRVAALVLVGPAGDPRVRTRLHAVARAARDAPFERPSLLLLVARDYLRAGARLVWHEMTHMLEHDITRVLPRVAAPTLVLRGARDAIAPARWVREVAALVPDAECRTVAGGAHAVQWSAADRVAHEIDAFLRART